MSKGAVDEGAPGVRSDGNYYAYIRDMDGNKIAAKKNLKKIRGNYEIKLSLWCC